MKCSRYGREIRGKAYSSGICICCRANSLIHQELENLKAKMGYKDMPLEDFLEKLEKDSKEIPEPEPVDMPEIEDPGVDELLEDVAITKLQRDLKRDENKIGEI